MNKVREAIGTLVRLLKAGPWGKGSPIPLRQPKPVQLDSHYYQATGVEEAAA
jgi:hypothetical protein